MASKNTSEYQLLIRLGAQVDKSVDSAIGKLTKKLGGLAILKIAKDAAVATGKAVLGYAKDSLEAYSTLEKNVVNAANVFGGTAEQVELNEDAIEKFSRGLAKKLPYSADQAADSLYYLGLVGLDLQDALGVAQQMMELAYINGGDVATTVDLITDAMSGLNKEINGENVTDFMDLLTKTMSSTNTNADQMLNAILGVGQTAGMVDLREDELAAYIGLLANYGTKDTQAGTALNSMFTRMIGNSTAIKAYKSLGVQMYDSSGGFKGVTSVLTQTEEALSKLTDEERNPIMKDLFGIHYMNEANVLLSAMDEKTDELGNKTSEYADILATVSDNAGTLDQMVGNSLDTWSAQSTIAKQQWDDLKYTFGKALEPAAVETLKWVNSTFFPQAEDAMEGIAGWIESQVPMIPEYLDTAYGYVQNMAEAAKEFLESEKWEEIKENLSDGAEHLENAFVNTDWDEVGKNAKSLYEAGVSLADGATNIIAAVSAVVDSPVGKLIGGVFDVVLGGANDLITAITGGDTSKSNSKYLQKFNDWISGKLDAVNNNFDKWNESSPNGIINSSFSELPGNQFKEASKNVEKFKEDIITVKEAMGQEDDPKKIKVYQESLRYLNQQLDNANAKLLTLQQQFQTTSGVAYPSTRVQRSTGNAKATPFADGGIVTRPTLSLIGEAGEKEAVIPLSKIGDVVRNVSGGSINYAPVINVTGGNAGEGVRQALRSGYEEFKAYYKQMVKEQKRLAF